ncbi:hypothetical protein GCM10009809_22860 [Isoptericola hypogeus]|uniref:Golgi phosphoprotein 3 (GPP34) n=1 Tax=Isoptericola hypogeus TaxID=300179 RepID=A0ABN2JGN2_9MICO
MLVAEELLLLAHDADRAGPSLFDDAPYRLAGALLVELVLAHRVTLGPRPGTSRPQDLLVVVLDPAPTGRPELDRALALAGSQPFRASDLVERLARQVERPLIDSLEARGLLRPEQRTTWGVLRSTRWRAVPGPAVVTLRRRVERALLDGAPPEDRTAALLTLADGAGWLLSRVPRDRRREAEARTHEVAESWWRGTAGREAAGGVVAATMAVITSAALVLPVAAT